MANVTRKDIRNLLPIAARANIIPEVERVDFEAANRALLEMKFKGSKGARVLTI